MASSGWRGEGKARLALKPAGRSDVPPSRLLTSRNCLRKQLVENIAEVSLKDVNSSIVTGTGFGQSSVTIQSDRLSGARLRRFSSVEYSTRRLPQSAAMSYNDVRSAELAERCRQG